MIRVIVIVLYMTVLVGNTNLTYGDNTKENDVHNTQRVATNIILADRLIHELRMLYQTLQPLIHEQAEPNDELITKGKIQLRHYHKVSERILRSDVDEYLHPYLPTDTVVAEGNELFKFLLNDDFSLAMPEYINTISNYVNIQYKELLSYPYSIVMDGLANACADVGELYYLTTTTTVTCH